ncbi:60S ribosomal protein L16-B [Diplonema papillatum]|nr:60S ribosomal protein L16-B [Diplonema papillatum]KAJ9471970.1 60S ribosomal protein L16-B [Diplonema papillatum]|eukprot:gene2273-3509_t
MVARHTSVDAKSKSTVVDMKGHLLGRVCSIVAKKLQNGEKVTLVRCEETNISGSHIRNKLKKLDIMKKRTLTNPKKGPFSVRSPSDMITRVLHGMITKNERNHAKRGKLAMKRLKCYDGVPASIEKTKRMLCPAALRTLRLAQGRDYCRLGRLSHELGWKQQAVVANLEEQRKIRGAKYFESKKAYLQLWDQCKAAASKEHPEQAALLAQYGY